jgi:acyl-CoA synthetase (AMP-forming)/AMP-acid ligase II
MLGLMQNRPLLVSTLVDYAASQHGGREIVSRDPVGVIHRTTYAAVAERAKRLARALQSLDVAFGQPVATLAWNGFSPSGALLWRNRLRPDPAHSEPAPVP